MPDTLPLVEVVASEKALIYKSPTIFERRRRILREARVMIAELGYENFNFRELARRADVAPRTLYNAFGSRENIVAGAIYWYLKRFNDQALFVEPADTLVGQMERAIRVHSRNLQIRAYAAAIMAVYNSQSAAPSIRQAIRGMSHEAIEPYVARLTLRRLWAVDVTPQRYAEAVASFIYSTLSSWTVGEIADGDMVEAIVESLLIVTATFTKGAARREAAAWLRHVRARAPEWRRLRADASASDQPPAAPGPVAPS